MTRRTLSMPIALAAVLAAATLQAQQEFVLYLSMLDASGNAPATLTPEQVMLTEGGQPLTVLRVEKVDWPVKVQVLVDNGIGLGSENLIHIRNGVRDLMKALPTEVEVSLYTTAPQPRAVVRPTTDRLQLIQGADRIAPDSGTGRYVESLNEATQRIERDKTRHFPVIISVATSMGDTNVMERDVDQLWKRLNERPTTVHTVLLSGGGRNRDTFTAANQTQVGLAVKNLTGGRYDNIAAASRLASLLPEIGEQVAASHRRQSRQFRLVIERPKGRSGPLGTIAGSLPPGYTSSITSDGAMP
jgi:hypothetical protein